MHIAIISINPDHDDVHAFGHYLEAARAQGYTVPESIVMRPGDTLSVEGV